MMTLEQALMAVNELPIEQREMLIEIVKNQMIESYRDEIAQNAKEAREAFQRGELKPQPLEDIINELKTLLEDIFTPQLATHSLQGKLLGLKACSCGYDCRIIFSLERPETNDKEQKEVIILIDIGTYDRVY